MSCGRREEKRKRKEVRKVKLLKCWEIGVPLALALTLLKLKRLRGHRRWTREMTHQEPSPPSRPRGRKARD